jgi:Tfp pilus assembly protein PilF
MLPLGAALAALTLAAAAMPAPRADYADRAFTTALSAGLRAFYARDFGAAADRFDEALALVPDNSLAISFRNAAAAQQPGALERLTAAEEDAVAQRPRDYVARVRLGFSYLFAAPGSARSAGDAREELDAALAVDRRAAAAHDGMGILRAGERSANRAKLEFQAALTADPDDVLAHEYLALLYQVDLKDPQRGLAELIGVPNLVPDYADAYFHLASLLHDLKQPAAAIGYATHGLELDVGHVGEAGRHGYTLLARIYLEQKRLSDARRVLEASIAADVDAIYATALLQKIDRGDYGPVGK